MMTLYCQGKSFKMKPQDGATPHAGSSAQSLGAVSASTSTYLLAQAFASNGAPTAEPAVPAWTRKGSMPTAVLSAAGSSADIITLAAVLWLSRLSSTLAARSSGSR